MGFFSSFQPTGSFERLPLALGAVHSYYGGIYSFHPEVFVLRSWGGVDSKVEK